MTDSASATFCARSPIAARPALLAAGLFMAGIVLHRTAPVVPMLWIGLVGVLAVLALVWIARPRVCTITLAVALAFAGLAGAQLYAFQFPTHDISAFAGDEPRLAHLQVEILTPPRVLTDPFGENRALPPKQIATARVERLKTWNGWVESSGDLLLQVTQPHPRLQAGQHIEALGRLQRPAPAMN